MTDDYDRLRLAVQNYLSASWDYEQRLDESAGDDLDRLRSELAELTDELPTTAIKDGDLLREALLITTGPRASAYGHASDNLGRTARLLDAYLDGLDRPLTAGDVAAILICVKLARLHKSPDHYDSLLDVAGYASAAWDAVTGPDGQL
jgi:hypothetical protein